MKKHWIFLIIAIILGGVFSYFASSFPDGLEWVAEKLSFIDKASEPHFEIIPDYEVPFIDSPFFKVALSGILGVLIVWILTYGVLKLIKK